MTTTWVSAGSNASSSPRTSLSAITPITPTSGLRSKASSSVATTAAAPCGLCAASSSTVGDRRTTSSRPGTVTAAKPVARDVGVEPLEPEERLHRGEREAGVRGLVGPVQRDEDVLDGPLGPVQPHQLAVDGELAAEDAEVDALALRQRADLGAPLEQDLRGLQRLARQDRVRAGLDDPGLLAGDLGDRGAQQVGVVEVDRGDDGDAGVRDVRGVPGAPEADLDRRRRRPGRRRRRRTPSRS